AKELQTLRTRIEIMRMRKVSDRLDAYLELYGPPEAGGWVRVADWIGVTPPALYRELGKRRENGPNIK
ncbi:MAG: Crp/Fnr family transcriptional regulator, partial [Cyanobacteria bacterium J06614_10]